MQADMKIRSKLDGSKAEVLQVSKDGKRIRIEFWSPLHERKLVREWTWASGWEPR